jgi:hypothetical protein
MQPSEGNGADGIQMRVQSGQKRRILVAETEAAAIAFTPNPELAIDEQRRVEEATRNTHLHNGPFFVIKKWSRSMAQEAPLGWGESEGGLGDDEVGHRGWVQPILFDAAAELARGASTPGEELEGHSVVVIGFRSVQKGHSGG